MTRLRLMAAVVAALALAGPGSAQSVGDEVQAALVAQGYDIVTVGRTWLGRLRVVAENGEIRREIVINPTTGEVLRDYAVALDFFDGPLFPGDDRNAVNTGAARATADAPDTGSAAADSDTESGSMAVGPPLIVEE